MHFTHRNSRWREIFLDVGTYRTSELDMLHFRDDGQKEGTFGSENSRDLYLDVFDGGEISDSPIATPPDAASLTLNAITVENLCGAKISKRLHCRKGCRGVGVRSHVDSVLFHLIGREV